MRIYALVMRALGGAGVIFGLLLVSSTAVAQDKTPGHVYQAVGGLEAKVRAILKADFIDMVEPAEIAAAPRKPRHVYAKLVEIDDKLARLRRLNGLPAGDPLVMPAKAIAPGDVFAGLAVVVAKTDALLERYGLPREVEAEPLAEGKTPGDVYARLRRVSKLLGQSFASSTVPNDVFRVAETIRVESDRLVAALGRKREVAELKSAGKSPADVLKAAIGLSRIMAAVAERRAELAPSGGVFAPELMDGAVTPEDVRDALNLIVADLLEMRVKAGVDAAFELAAQPSGKTPSDVFHAIRVATSTLFPASRG